MRIGIASESGANEVHYYGNPPTSQFPYSNTRVLEKTYAFAGWLATPIDLVRLFSNITKILQPEEINFIVNKPKHIIYPKLTNEGNIPYFYSTGFWMFPTKKGLNWSSHGGFTGTRAIVVKRTDGNIISLLFNARPLPNLPALRDLRRVILNLDVKAL